MSLPLSVLHVVESYGGGVATALQQYALATPEIRHILLRAEREGDYVDAGEMSEFAEVFELPRSAISAIRCIRKIVHECRPDVIHAHSSFAGLFVRLGIRASPRRPIVYTPHGYASERADVSWLAGRLFRLVEVILSFNTTSFAACSPREAALSEMIGAQNRVIYVPNVVDVELKSAKRLESDKFRVVAAGRLTPARDPLFFRDVARIVSQARPDIEFLWVGGGEEPYVSALTAAGVEVTGWLPRDEALMAFSGGHLHFHPAAWDGFPMVLLEANALAIPSIVRSIPAFVDVSTAVRFGDAEEFASAIITMSDNPKIVEGSLRVWDDFLKDNVREIQSMRLFQAYEMIKAAAQ